MKLKYRVKNCPLCDSSNSSPTFHPLYCMCSFCKVVYQFSGIRKVQDYYDDINAPPNCAKQLKLYRNYLKVAHDYFSIRKKINIIDIGAADGTFLDLVRRAHPNYNVYAIEQSLQAKKLLAAKNIPLIETENLHHIKSKYIFCFQVLEHIHNPINFIKSLSLTKGDFLFLTSPATDSTYYIRNKFYWRSYSPSHHLLLYNKQSLEYLFYKCDLNLVNYFHCYSRSNTHSRLTSLFQHAKSQIIWIASWVVNGYSPRPRYHGRSSFFAIANKKC